MYTPCKYDTSSRRIRIDFTRIGRRSFNRVNAKLGSAFIRFYQLERDLAEYIERHLDNGIDMISEFDVRYDDGILLTVYLSGGIYYIKEVTVIGEIIAHKAVWLWQKIKHGCDLIACQILSGWYFLTADAC